VVDESEESGYPFADLSRLRADAGAFMHRVLNDEGEDDVEMEDDESQHVITPDFPWFSSGDAPLPPQGDAHRPIAQLPLKHEGIWNASSERTNGGE